MLINIKNHFFYICYFVLEIPHAKCVTFLVIELRTQSLRSILALCARPSRFSLDPCVFIIICPNDVKYFYQFVKTDFDLHLNLNYRSKILQFLVSNGIERVAYFSDNRTTFKQIFSCHLGF